MSSLAKYYWDKQTILDELVELGDVTLGRGNVISKIDIKANPGPFPIYSSSAKNNGKMGEYGNYMFDEELISWSVDGGGYFFYRPKHKFSITNVSGYMRLSERWDYKFVVYNLQFQHDFLSFDYQSKAHPSVIRELYYLPDINIKEQKKIAAILTSVDDVIEFTQAQINKLKDLKTGMMQELLTKGIGHSEFKDSPVGRIPKAWEVVKLDSVSEIVDSMHQTPIFVESGKPMVRVTEIRQGDLLDITNAVLVSDETFDAFSKNYQPIVGDILIARVGAYFGATSLIDQKMNFCLGQNTASIRSIAVNHKFVFQFLNSRLALAQMNDAVAVGAQPSLSLKSIKDLKIPLPSPAEQLKISASIDSIAIKIRHLENKLQSSLQLKKALMQDLLTGKVRVKVN